MKFKNHFFTLVLLALLINCLSHTVCMGQIGWVHTYGTALNEKAASIHQTPDGGYILGGYTQPTTKNAQIVKLDAQGGQTWTKTYNFPSFNSQIRELISTNDGGYASVITAEISSGLLFTVSYLYKLNPHGDTLWSITYANNNLSLFCIQQTSDNGYILGGGGGNGSGTQMHLIKTDSLGNTLWTHDYGTQQGSIQSVKQTIDNGYICAGKYSNAVNNSLYGLIKTDSIGDTLWTLTKPVSIYGHETNLWDVQLTLDNGYITVGQEYDSSNYNYYGIMRKVSQGGTLEWEVLDTTSYTEYRSVWATMDSGYVYTGTRHKTINGFNRKVFILGKRDAMGNLLWESEYLNGIIGYSVQETANREIIAAGHTNQMGAGQSDMYVILTDSLGNYKPGSIVGNVYQDLDLSCDSSSGDINLSGIVVKASLNGNTNIDYYGTTDSLGHYVIPCQGGSYTMEIPQLSPYYALSCPQNTGTITALPYDTIDFPLEVTVLCPTMAVDISAPIIRQIIPSTYTIQYCNHGTIPAQNAVVTVDIDSFLNIHSFSQTPTSQSGNSYTFNVGTVNVGQCSTINITVQVDTTAIWGQTHCVEASITPDTLCTSNPWTGMLLDVNGTCQNDSVFFTINNHSINSVLSQRTYWVFEDDIIMRTGTVNVPNGSSAVISVAAQPRKFYRIEVAQEAGIPWTVSDPIVSAFVEGCVPDINGEFNTGFPLQFPNGHAPTFKAIDCQPNSQSYDPNNKIAQPQGYSSNHYINTNQYIDYQINFQNTGNDTAFFVTLIDTLSEHLDPASIQVTSASHPYTWQLKNFAYFDPIFWQMKTVAILEVKFDMIMLPDSNINEPASHGFVKFRIQQKANNPVGTVINNFADIYFDLNAPVRTNTTYHEIGANFYLVTIVKLENESALEVQAFPNPFTQQTTIRVSGKRYDELNLLVYDVMGRQVDFVSEVNSNEITLQRNALEKGIYVFKLLGDGKPISSGKIIAQ